MVTPKAGDRVRVTLDDATVAWVLNNTADVQHRGSTYTVHVDTLTVTTPKLAEVGDVVETIDQLDALPVGAVVEPLDPGRPVAAKYRGGWYLANELHYARLPHLPAKVLSLRGDA